MKYLPFILIVLLVICFLIVQPLQMVDGDTTYIFLHLGRTVPLAAITEVNGGYKCYLDSGAYFWLSDDNCVTKYSDCLAVEYKLWRPTTIYRREP